MRVGICSIQRNRGPWIREWVLFHYLLGVRYFYIGLHKTHDDSIEILRQLNLHINIKFFEVSDETYQAPQQDFYQFTLDHFLHEVDWMAVIDGDEFLFPVKVDSLQAALQKFTAKIFSALGVQWRCFGSSGHIKEPHGLILDNYKQRAPDDFPPNRHIKSVIQSKYARGTITTLGNTHHFETPFGTLDELGRQISGALSEHKTTAEHLRINHYVCQSREFFVNVKRPQGAADVNPNMQQTLRSESWWLEHDRNDVKCEVIDRFIPKLKELDQCFSKGIIEEARAPDSRMPISKRISFLSEMALNFSHNRKLTRSRFLGLGIKKIK